MPGILHSLRVYAAARRVAREIRSLPPLTPSEAFAFAQSHAWYGGDTIRANQREGEIVALLELLRAAPPSTVLEIGMDRGGTLFLWSRVATDDALLVTVEREPVYGRLGRRSPFALVRHSFAREAQRVVIVDRASSAAPGTIERVRAALAGRLVDFLFVDGDHRYEAVRRDYELYGPFVRPGGVIAFHDIRPGGRGDKNGVARLWRELADDSGSFVELVEGEGPGYGIGVYRLPLAPSA